MSPKLRSSSRSATPSTPIGRSSDVSTPSSTPGRKVPHCRTCGKPRAGHPRSGCKPADTSASPDASEGESTEVENDNIVNALGSIRLSTPASPFLDKMKIRSK
ncbi:hypothetical protein BDQ17DRAFT_1423591 [Cyathus striatus]|nr:hypothetical protein BDQ17DRAFT_1423591 [Cyathus striatus]